MNRRVLIFAILTVASVPALASAETIAGDMFDSSIGLISFTLTPEPGTFTSLSDAFQVFQAGEDWPSQLADKSNVEGETDTRGIIDVASKTDAWFGVSDTINGDNPSGQGTAVWVFDVSGKTRLSASVDMGAMGDFENTDLFDWTYSIDGGEVQALFVSSVDEEASYVYTLADGVTTTELDDPLLINEAMVTNVLQTFTAPIVGSGSELTITFSATADGGSEAYAFDNLMISGTIGGSGGDPIPGDYNDNGSVEQGDLNLVRSGWGSDNPGLTWVNHLPGTDGFLTDLVDQEELDEVLLNWGTESSSGVLGDYDESGTVGQGDLDLVRLGWGSYSPGSAWTDQLPGSESFSTLVIDQEELDRVLMNWGNAQAVAAAASVPEPTGIVLILVALGSLVSLRRRR